jgi:5-methylthioribose kinase
MIIDKDNIAEYVHARHLLDVPPEADYSVVQLGGGFLNTVLRISCGGQSIIVKQALDALRLFPDLKVTTDRIVFEHQALIKLNELFPEQTMPPILHFDDADRILVMGDLGQTPLLETMLINGQVDPVTAERLGTFLAELHRRTYRDDTLRAQFDNEAMQQLRLQYCFYFVTEPALLEVAHQLGRIFTEEKQVLLHGDFWTASVMAQKTGIQVFDLEFTYYGHPAQDIGFMMAHYLLHAYNTPPVADAIFDAVSRLWKTYATGMGDLMPKDCELIALRQAGLEMIFRIDGINQVKYITNEEVKARIRVAAKRLMLDEQREVEDIPIC